MAERTVVMCDRKIDGGGQLCETVARGKCVVCRSDFCGSHLHVDGLKINVEAGRLYASADIGPICRECAHLNGFNDKKGIEELLLPHRDQIASIIRAYIVAEGIK